MKRNSFTAALLSVVLLLQGCFSLGGDGKNETAQLAGVTYEIQGLLLDAQTGIYKALKTRTLKPDDAVAATNVVDKFNAGYGVLLQKIVDQLKPGTEELQLSESGKSQLQNYINAFGDTALQIVSDPAILNLDSATRAGVQAAFLALKPVILRLSMMVGKVPANKTIAPPLRDQLQRVTQGAEIARQQGPTKLHNRILDLAAQQAEVLR